MKGHKPNPLWTDQNMPKFKPITYDERDQIIEDSNEDIDEKTEIIYEDADEISNDD